MMNPPRIDDRLETDPKRRGVTKPGGEISLVDTFNVMLRHRRLIAGAMLAAMALSVAVTLLTKRTYTSSAAFVTESRPSGTDLASVAAQFGVNLVPSRGERPPRFYADLLESRLILRDVLLDTYESVHEGERRTGDLLDFLDVQAADSERLREERGLEALGLAIETDVDRETGVVTYSVTMPSADLSQAVAARLLEAVKRFNVGVRQAQAREERTFIEERLGAASAELEAAQQELATFLQANRDFEGSAQKQFFYQNLQTEVMLRRQLYSSLSEALEQARIAEVQNTPVLMEVDPPQIPAKPDSRRGLVRLILAAMLGTFIALIVAFGREFSGSGYGDAEASLVEFRRLRQEALHDLRRPWRALRRSG
jgi:uncharacterized protein involved in exopolysaccharide biosynthesis